MAIALFASHKCESPEAQPLKVGKGVIWIRVQDFGLEVDLMEALGKAHEHIRGDEMILNTINKTVCRNVKSK